MGVRLSDIISGIGACGLVCALCSYQKNCTGCASKTDCAIKDCCVEKKLTHCFMCPEQPCNREMLKGTRVRAFNETAKSEGLNTLAEYLYRNYRRGITYHRTDGLAGDYDRCKTEREVIDLLKNGKPDPFILCPVYESKSFLLRLVSQDDAEDLLKCYANPRARKFFNADSCTSDFFYDSIDEMRACIAFWLEENGVRKYVRFSIVDKANGEAVGTAEIIRSRFSILRVDILPKYENDKHLSELFCIADSFFHDFGCEKIAIKAIPEAEARILALIKNGYCPYPPNQDWEREHYYIKAME